MSNTLNLNLAVEVVRYILAASVTGAGYVALGNGGLTALQNAARQLLIQNGTDGDVMISFDGVTDHFPVFKGSFVLLDVTTNKNDQAGSFYLAAGTSIYAIQLNAAAGGTFAGDYTNPTTGAVFATIYYGR